VVAIALDRSCGYDANFDMQQKCDRRVSAIVIDHVIAETSKNFILRPITTDE
jgi:hypothetical protein